MILGFRHKGLERLFEKGDRGQVSPKLIAKVERVLARLDEAKEPRDMDLPGFGLHPLKGSRAGYWSVRVSGNWRITFCFEGQNIKDVDLIDYH